MKAKASSVVEVCLRVKRWRAGTRSPRRSAKLVGDVREAVGEALCQGREALAQGLAERGGEGFEGVFDLRHAPLQLGGGALRSYRHRRWSLVRVPGRSGVAGPGLAPWGWLPGCGGA